ncbi:MAG TPA: UbiX family flavin prenyltransferase, partial [Anaerolineales bacterium]|nr:UbiX family flavin prenyltransferase [Anaerolineales bacterium]
NNGRVFLFLVKLLMEQNAPQMFRAKKAAPYRLIVGMTGASGAILGIRLLETLKSTPIETHLILSEHASLTITQETNLQPDEVHCLANFTYDFHNIGASIASGSFDTLGMVIIPCSIKTLSAVANSYTDDLISRAADVTLKEGRKLVLVVRETPLHAGHLRLMREAALAGAVIFPPVPAFYVRPRSVDEIIDNTVGRILLRMGIENSLYHEWQGHPPGNNDEPA